jgi:hypothetical protein
MACGAIGLSEGWLQAYSFALERDGSLWGGTGCPKSRESRHGVDVRIQLLVKSEGGVGASASFIHRTS